MMMLNDFEWSIMQATYAAEVSGSGLAPRDRVKAKVWPRAALAAFARRQAGASEDAPVSDAQSRSRKKSVEFEDTRESTLQKRAAAAMRMQVRTRAALDLPPLSTLQKWAAAARLQARTRAELDLPLELSE